MGRSDGRQFISQLPWSTKDKSSSSLLFSKNVFLKAEWVVHQVYSDIKCSSQKVEAI